MSLFSALSISALRNVRAANHAAEVITENLANAETTRTPDGGPYRRKDVVFESDGGSALVLIGIRRRDDAGWRVGLGDQRRSGRSGTALPARPSRCGSGRLCCLSANQSGGRNGGHDERIARVSGQHRFHERVERHDSAFDRFTAINEAMSLAITSLNSNVAVWRPAKHRAGRFFRQRRAVPASHPCLKAPSSRLNNLVSRRTKQYRVF